jgi:hypothetical protein
MARGAAGEALEPVAFPGQPLPADPGPAGPSRPRRRRGPVVVIAAGVVTVGLVVPVRLQVAKDELVALQAQFAASTSMDDAAQRVVAQLQAATYPGDEQLTRAAATDVLREEAQLLEQVDHRLTGGLIVDTKLGGLRTAMRLFLRLRIGDLRSGRIVDPKTKVQLARVNALMAGERRRFDLTGPAPAAAPGPALRFAAAASARATTRHWLDRPTGDGLLAVGDSLLRLDVDASRSTRLAELTPLPGEIIPRQGYTALADGTTVTAETEDWQGSPRVIGQGVEAFPAARPDAVWIVADDTVREVDGQGHLLVPPATTTGFVASVAVGDSIAIQTQDALVLWDPRTHRTTCRVGGIGAPIAADADVVAWVDPDGGLNLTRTSTCTTTAWPAPAGADRFGGYLAAAGAISPDGRTLACLIDTEGLAVPVFRLVTVDLATGRMTLPTATGLSARTLPIVWTGDSRRIYFTATTPGGADFPTTYHLGDPEVHALRFRAPPGFYVAAIIP